MNSPIQTQTQPQTPPTLLDTILKTSDALNSPYVANQYFSSWFESWRTETDEKNNNPNVSPDELVKVFKAWTDVIRKLSYSSTKENYADNEIRIVLNVMMKNEHPVMERCITSALPIVDAVCYSDTGSTGDVFTILRKAVPSKIPLCVEVEPWKDFGYNRTSGLDQTQRFVHRLGWNPDTTYILVIDADMTLTITPAFEKKNLKDGTYMIQQHNGGHSYWNMRVLQVSKQWHVVGRTHEYYSCKLPCVQDRLYTLIAVDHNDGMNRSEKCSRDILLLNEDLKDNPKNARSMFYLAETYRHRALVTKSNQDFNLAIEYYKKHIETGSWEEEMWYSMYAIGMCYGGLNDTEKMIMSYLAAFQRRPHRSEPLFRLAKYYRDKEQHFIAMIFFKQAASIPFPAQDQLFVDKEIYDYNILSEMSISAYYSGDKVLGEKCVQILLKIPNVHPDVRQMANYNVRFYIKALPHTTLTQIMPKLVSPYRPCNPSIGMRNGELIMICRTVNYDQANARNYKVLDGTGIFNTENVLLTYDISQDTPRMTSQKPIEHTLKGQFVSTCTVQGLEDARVLVLNNGKLVFSCTSLEVSPDNLPRICWCILDEDKESCRTTSFTRISGHDDDIVQKNWLPFVQNNEVYFIYGYHPFTILKFNQAKCKVEVHKQFVLPVGSSAWRGSSGPVLVPNIGYILLIHEVCDLKEGRHYMHRFIIFDETFSKSMSMSNLFYFKHGSGVEMATGMVYNDGKLYISFGVEDSSAYLASISVEHVMKFLSN
jgi:tetratricopeptide (TPR) repeat protein